jgi:hypothetical protein
MRWTRVALGLVVATHATAVLSADKPPTAFEEAVLAAEANEATPTGREFHAAVERQFVATQATTIAHCADGFTNTNLEEFDLLMKLDASGTVIEALVYPETAVATCLRSSVAHGGYPAPAHTDYWVRVEMAFSRGVPPNMPYRDSSQSTRRFVRSRRLLSQASRPSGVT